MTHRSSPSRGWKWFGTLACGLILALLLLSGRYRLYLTTRWGCGIEAMAGSVTFQWLDRELPRPPAGPVVQFRTARRPDPYDLAGLLRWPRYWPPGIRRVQSGSDVTDVWYLDGFCTVPGWMILLVGAVPTGWLWWKDRRRIPPGHCRKCGYNLTGNASGRCPECGEAEMVGPESSARQTLSIRRAELPRETGFTPAARSCSPRSLCSCP